MNWNAGLEKEILQDLCKKSFWHFLSEAWGVAHWPTKGEGLPFLTERIHKPLCDWYQYHALDWLKTRRRKHLMIIVPRFFGKTTIITKAGQLWLHLWDQELATYTGSETQGRAEEFTGAIGKVISDEDEHARFSWLYGNWYNKNREWRLKGMVHGQRKGTARSEYSFGTWSIERMVTGHHPDVGFLDDPISYTAIDLHSDWLHRVNNHVADLMPIFTDNSMLVFPGTRYGENDHFGKQLKVHGAATWSGMKAPPDYTSDPTGRKLLREDGKWHVYFLDARDSFDEDKPTFPEHCGEHFLKDFETDNEIRYWAQMRNQPSQSETNPLTLEQINDLWIDKAKVPNLLRRVVCMDTAFAYPERQARGDESVLVVLGYARDGSGEVYFLEGYGSNIWRMEEFLEKLVWICQKYDRPGRRISRLTDEPEPGGKTGTWEYVIRTKCNEKGVIMPPLTRLPRQGKQKYRRIVTAADYWAEGYMRLVRDAPGVERLVDQMARIPSIMINAYPDDWADAAADAFHDQLYIPPKRVAAQEQEVSPSYPGDEILKVGRLRDEEVVKRYDEWHGSEEYSPYEPV